jgi:hypothetical protein
MPDGSGAGSPSFEQNCDNAADNSKQDQAYFNFQPGQSAVHLGKYPFQGFSRHDVPSFQDFSE